VRGPASSVPVVQVAGFYPPHLGGVEVVAKSLAQGLSAFRPVRVLTTSCGAEELPRTSTEGTVRVDRLWGKELAHTPVSPGLAWRLLTLPRRTLVHAHIAQALLPELVALTSLIRRRRYVLHFHLDVDATGTFGRLLPAYKTRVLGPALRRADAVLVLNGEQADFVATTYGVARHKLHVLPNGVDPAYFQTTAPDLSTGALKLLFVGRLSAQKNVKRLIAALALVTVPLDVVIVGDGELRGDLERQAAGLTGVRFVGAQHGEALRAWYSWADAFVLPSDKEGIPLVLLEAMAAGLPVLATDVDGTRELVGGVGLLVPPTPEGVAAGITELQQQPELRGRLSAQSSAAAVDFSWTHIVDQLQDVYAAVLS
jgi:glycosyltransferase involved in cell wall biosynthesis